MCEWWSTGCVCDGVRVVCGVRVMCSVRVVCGVWLQVKVVDGMEVVKTNPEVQVAPDELSLVAIQWNAVGLLIVHEWDQGDGGTGDGRHRLQGDVTYRGQASNGNT